MATVLGVIGMLVFIVATIALAAGITYIVARITPSEPRKKPSPTAES